MRKGLSIWFLLMWGIVSPVEGDEETPAVELPAMVVTASRIPATTEEVPLNLSVIDRDTLDASPALAMDDVLQQVPGFSLFRRSSSIVAHPTTQGVSLRGVGPTGASRSLVLLDGLPLNDPFGGWVHWSRIPMVAVDRVELVRGGGSTAWGNSAMGGVIHVLTIPPDERMLRVEGLAGNHGTRRIGFFGSELAGPVGLSLEGQHFSTDGYHVVRKDQRGEIDVPAYSRHNTLNGRLRWMAGPDATVDLKVGSFSERRGNGTPYTGNETDAVRLSTGVDWRAGEGAFNWMVFGEQTDFASTFSSVAPDRSSETPALDQFDVPARVVGSGLQWSRLFDRHELVIGVDGRWVDGETNEDFLFADGEFVNRRRAGGRQILGGLYLEDIFEPGEDWRVSVGGRVDYWRSFRGELVQSNRQTGAVTQQTSFEDRDAVVLNPRAGVVRFLNPALSLRGAIYRGFRVPTINELYRPFRVGQDTTLANAELGPERLTGIEAGADFQPTPRWSGKITVFQNRLDDAIANVTIGETDTGGALRQRQNLNRADIRGLEVETGYDLNQHLRLHASYLFSDAEVKRAPQQPDLEGRRLAQVPEHQVVIGTLFRWEETWRLNVQGRYTGPQFEDDLNTRTLAGFWVFDLGVAREFGPGSAIFAGVENLFDRVYTVGETGDGLVTIGAPRLLHGGVRWQF